MGDNADNSELSEYLVRVGWIKTLPADKAIWQKGMFANQNIVCTLQDPSTLSILEEQFGLVLQRHLQIGDNSSGVEMLSTHQSSICFSCLEAAPQ